MAALITCGLISTGWFMTAGYAAPRAGDSQPVIVINQYFFSGQSLVPETELAALLKDSVGKPATFSDLERQADIVTRYLRSKGYFVAFAYIPAQDFVGGDIKIVIEPGHYDQVIINNKTEIREDAIRRELGGVTAGAVVEKKSLERAVWLIGDLAGAEAKTSLQAGSQPGTTTLTVNVTPEGKKTWGYVGVDNGGYRYTGRMEYTALVNQANPLREGDLLTLSGLYTGEGQSAGSLSYTTPVWDQGSRIGISYARSRYLLGDIYSDWDLTGTADVLSFSYQKNLQRSRNANWYAQLRFDSKRLHDKAFGMIDTRKDSHNWVAGINGDTLDTWQGGGANTYSLTYTGGDLRLHDPVEQVIDDTGLRTAGSFGKYNLNLTRLQQVRERLALYLTYSYQWADKNLDASEKMYLGGPYAVRAYPVGEASGDEGWLGSAELRWNLPNKEGAKDVWQLITFVDAGSVLLNKDPLPGVGDNRRSLSGMGVGVNWSRESNWAARLHYAWKLGSEEAQSDTDKSGRFWFQLYKFF
ncbi:ShlB/FhaC/HecB family hemolysin secretion/activation protein [Propionispora hippei]|uniref:Hemolysin activation/secretion protein n=1 Tax=Propionispora hippei DSM 15287 TaxID=1123003 RepID=A0A1M6F1E6_9FIRM|nr:ShlB/FhaC/HecB family hemolysin secretion/activation protein [Propionispora hippei]SHI91476.1 Hemolysin activation/secretion protein [Propionispora hippei DSM 15287]